MLLRELIKEMRRAKGWTQAAMAAQLETSQQNIQQMENAGSNLEKQWAIFLKLLPYCIELDLIGESNLLLHTKHGSKQPESTSKAGKAKAIAR
jgi:DNA-binding XRE family transcriptional regulator